MALTLDFISLIIPIEKIEKYYPGGFEQFKKDRDITDNEDNEWYDDYIFREGAMAPADIEDKVNEWKKLGVNPFTEKDGKKMWDELCVVDYLGGKTLPCDWLIVEGEKVRHIKDKS